MLSRKIHIFVGPFNAVDPEVASNKEGQRPHRELLLFPLGEGWLTIPYYVLDGKGWKVLIYGTPTLPANYLAG